MSRWSARRRRSRRPRLFGQLAQSVTMPAAGRSLEDLVREMLRPLLKDWLDQNLAPIVQARVQAEVERVSRGRGY